MFFAAHGGLAPPFGAVSFAAIGSKAHSIKKTLRTAAGSEDSKIGET
jgi:hypothetical protein